MHEKGDGAKKKVKMLAINLEAVTHYNRGENKPKNKSRNTLIRWKLGGTECAWNTSVYLGEQ